MSVPQAGPARGLRAQLDATGLGSGAGGDETMLTGVLEGLALVAGEGDHFQVVAADGAAVPPSVLDHPAFSVTRVPRRPGPLHFSLVAPRLAAAARPRPDVVFSPTHGPLWSPVPLALMVQDLSFEHRPGDYPPGTRLRLQQVVRRQVRAAATVLTVSHHAAADLVATYGLDPARVHVVPNAALPPLDVPEADVAAQRAWLRQQGVVGPYLLYLGNLHPRKNVATALRAFARLRRDPAVGDLQFVVAGARWWGEGEQQAAAAAPEGSVVFLGRVDEVRREVLLGDARALVYLSLFEGFGLPPLEAMVRGTPVVASDRTSIPEVVGDGGLLVDPLDVDAVTDALRRVVTDDGLRERLSAAGRERARAYDVRATGEAMAAALRATVEAAGRGAGAAGTPLRPVHPRAGGGGDPDRLLDAVRSRVRLPDGDVVDLDAGDAPATALLARLDDGAAAAVVARSAFDGLAPDDRRRAVREACRVLAPGGAAVLRTGRPPGDAEVWDLAEAAGCVVLDGGPGMAGAGPGLHVLLRPR